MKTYAIIPAGGLGLRAGSNTPKQYINFSSKPLLAYTLQTFQDCEKVDDIVIPIQPKYFELLNNMVEEFNFSKVTKIIEGGRTRQDSVFNALSSVKPLGDDKIIVHDAVRPLLSKKLLEEALNSAEIFDSIVMAIKAKDTLINGSGFVDGYVERGNVYYVQTPQIFKYSILKEAFDIANEQIFLGTDESMLVKNAGFNVKIIEGSSLNFKITTKDDLELFRIIISTQENGLKSIQ